MKVCVVALALTSLASSAAGQERVSLTALVSEALASHPRVLAAERRVDAAMLRVARERSLPDPMISVGYTSVGRPWPGAGLGVDPNAAIGVMVTQPLALGGKRELAGRIATREADAEQQEIDAARLAIVSRVKQAYYGLAYTYAIGDVLTRNQQLLETLLEVSEGRYAVGHAAQQDVIKAQTELSILALRLERNRQDRAAREGEINALLSRAPGAPLGQPEDLVPRRLRAFAGDARRAGGRARADAEARSNPGRKRGAWRRGGHTGNIAPDYSLSGGYASMGSMPPMYEVRLDVTIPLQRSRRAAAVAEKSGLLTGVRHEYKTPIASTSGAHPGRLHARLDLASTGTTSTARRYMPQARLGLESSMASYQTGRVDFLSLLTSSARCWSTNCGTRRTGPVHEAARPASKK